MVSSNQTGLFLGLFLRILSGAATCAPCARTLKSLVACSSKPRRFAEAALHCSAQQMGHGETATAVLPPNRGLVFRPCPTGKIRQPHHGRRAHHLCARRSCQQTRRPAHFFIVTNVMPFTRLLASMKLPSRVTDVLRTMFPPPGIAQLWNFAVLGSKRTTVFGVDPDSLYQMLSLIAEMP